MSEYKQPGLIGATEGKKTAVITGITGQDAAYLAEFLLSQSYKVVGVYRATPISDFSRLHYLGIYDQIELWACDLTDLEACLTLINESNPDEIYNLAAQSSVSYSFQFPRQTIEFNVISVLNLLESLRSTGGKIKFYQASSSEMYGRVNALPITSSTQLHPVSPYGISKATAHWIVSQYREAYGLYAVSGILFNHESYLRPDTFFVKKVVNSAVRIKRGLQENLVVGNIDIRRDFGFAKEYVRAIWMIMQQEQAEDFHVCSGISISLREIVYYVFNFLQLDIKHIIFDQSLYRPAEIEDIYGDKSNLENRTGWNYALSFFDVLDILIQEELENDLGNEY